MEAITLAMRRPSLSGLVLLGLIAVFGSWSRWCSDSWTAYDEVGWQKST
jgi:hypothetical protein